MTEKDLQNEIRIYLSERGFTPFRANVGRFKSTDGRWVDIGLPKGFSDLFAIKDGKIYFFEVKVKPNKPTKNQLNFLEQMRKIGCVAEVVYSLEQLGEVTKGVK